MYSSC
jgi:hypothetical protein